MTTTIFYALLLANTLLLLTLLVWRGWRTPAEASLPTLPRAQLQALTLHVEKIYPEMVSAGADGGKVVNYAQLCLVLLDALQSLADLNAGTPFAFIQEQQFQIETLKKQAASATAVFEQRLRALEAAGKGMPAGH